MLILASHVFALIALTIAAAWDLMTTEVPDPLSIAVIIFGLASHGAVSYVTGGIEPLVWSIGVGLALSLYGWGMYFTGSWGGADAMAISALGFAAPYSLSGFGIFHAADLFINIMLLGFIYALIYAFYKAATSRKAINDTFHRIKNDRKRIALEIAAAGVISYLLGMIVSLNPMFYFISITLIIFLYRFLMSIEQNVMTQEISTSDLEVGDVVETSEIEMKHVREKNPVGILLTQIKEISGSETVGRWNQKYGYSEIVGVTETEVDKIKSQMETVKIKTGIRFVPVFPVALFITDMGFLGLRFLFGIFS